VRQVRAPVTRRPLLQEIFADDPWRIFVCCILLNQTGRAQVDDVIDTVFERWPDAHAMAHAPLIELAGVLHPTGLHWSKAGRLQRMSEQYTEWYETGRMMPIEIHGVGQYAVDSYEIFYCGQEDHEVPSRDKELLAYVNRDRYVCGSNYCDDPACEMEHQETL
jgi:endonuclease III